MAKTENKTKLRGFEIVSDAFKTAFKTFKDEKGKGYTFPVDIILPTRATKGSSGYDFYAPKDLRILPMQKTIVWSDVKAYMQPGEELLLFIRSSLAIKKGLMLCNCVGKIDSDYYSNPDNDGNIGFALVNTSGVAVDIKASDRIVQGTFYNYLLADDDKPLSEVREGGTGSTGE